MSTILVNTLTGTSTAGSIAVTGEGNSTTTNLQQGLVKSFGEYSADGTSILDSFNVSSLTDQTTGQQYTNYTNNMGSANYAIINAIQTVGNVEHFSESLSSSQSRHYAYDDSGSYVDNSQMQITSGDLA